MALIGSNILIQTRLIFQLGVSFICSEEGERERGNKVLLSEVEGYKTFTNVRKSAAGLYR